MRGCFGTFGPLCVEFKYFSYGFYRISCLFGCLNRNIAELLYGIVTFGWKCLGDHFLCFCRCPNYDDFPEELSSKVLQNLFWRHSFGPSGGGHFVASSSWLVLGGLFHRFGRCPHQVDFLEEFVFQGAPKPILVTLAPFGPSGGLSL